MQNKNREVTNSLQKNYRRCGYRFLSVWLFFPLCLLLFLPVVPLNASNQSTKYLDSLLALAREKQIHKNRYWHILLHYEKGIFGTASLIDDPDFFLSHKGKYDPKAELEASIKTFFRQGVKNDDFPICRYIARYTWLQEALNINKSRVALFKCDKTEQINPKSAALIFPTYYMNNPASMFGHTLVNIETDFSNKLLTKSVNYSAFTKETNGFLFAIKGLFGFYEGYYSVLPYYKKIQQYSDISQRDIWEYRLNLSKPELEKMVRHIRELENIHADYFFLDENCSYSLLYLLEAAKPSNRLTNKFHGWTLPIDTIKAVEKAGMIESVEFRPSKVSRIRHKISLLDKNCQQVAFEILNGTKNPEAVFELDIGRKERIVIIDLVVDYNGYQYARKKMTKSKYQRTLLSALKLRSKLGRLEEPYSPPHPPRPDRVHHSKLIDAGFGINMDESFIEIGVRPAFSDLLDTDYGYHQGVQIKFGDMRFRHYISENKFVLDSLGIIDIVSISPRNRFFKPLSWKVHTGVYREIMADGKESPIYRLGTGGGLAYYNNRMGLGYLFLEPELQYGTDLEENFSFGGGLSIGLVKDITKWWKCHISAKQLYFELGDDHASGKIASSQNFILTRNNHIRINASREKTFGRYNSEAKINWRWFF